jgi:proteasome lid subunit RPN8/RPN11
MWKIKKTLIEDACNAAKNYYPKEFMCFLGGEKKTQTIKEIVLMPTENTEESASINENVIPFDETIIGTIHSHPGTSNKPSQEDKKFFKKYLINAIICKPFETTNTAFYSEKGKEIKAIII